MGIRDFLKRRRERESALPPEALAELDGGVEAEAAPSRRAADGEANDGEQPRAVELPGADAAALGELLRNAASTGLPQVSFERHSVEVEGEAGSELAGEILAILGGAGGNSSDTGAVNGPQTLDPERAEELREMIREALRRQGIDPDSGEPA